jgi:hypothetical protein
MEVDMAYGDYLQTISVKFENLFQDISVQHNFDYGPEFEIALCKALRIILPAKFGICRGFAVTLDGDIAGDDIIIFDHERFPTLRLLEDNTYAQKQSIPIEAIYAYIEAKHTLYLEGDGGQSLRKACEQVAAVKSLQRPQVPFNQIAPYIKFGDNNIKPPQFWPSCRNPMFGAVVARYIQLKPKAPAPTNKLFPFVGPYLQKSTQNSQVPPDILVLGADIVCLPAVETQIESPFFIHGISKLAPCLAPQKSFGVGISALSWALDCIQLGTIYWPAILASGLGITLANNEWDKNIND